MVPLDILTVVVPYVLYDEDADELGCQALFTTSAFGRLGNSVTWRRLVSAQPEVIYRTYWSSNDYTASLFLGYEGRIDYSRLLTHSRGLIVTPSALTDMFGVDTKQAWQQALNNHYDLLLAKLRRRLTEQLRSVRLSLLSGRGGTGDITSAQQSDLRECLRATVSLTDVFIRPNPRLEAEFTALCDLIPAHVYKLLLWTDVGVINYEFWLRIYDTYLKPVVGGVLHKDTPALGPADISRWSSLWFTAAAWTNQLDIFTATYQQLGYSQMDVISLLHNQKENILSMTMLCQADADNIISGLDLWSSISGYILTSLIIPTAPRLRAQLHERGRILTLHDLHFFPVRGCPTVIRPFLPGDSKLLGSNRVAALLAGPFLAMRDQANSPLSWRQIYELFRSDVIKYQNLANHILPVERVLTPAFRAELPYLTTYQEGDNTSSTAAVALSWEYIDRQSDYAGLYRLFLLYFVEIAAHPRVSFRYYTHEFSANPQLVTRTPSDFSLTQHHLSFSPCGHVRLFTMECDNQVILYPITTSVINHGQTMYIYIPAHTAITILDLDNNMDYSLYDYDVPDFAWLKAACGRRYKGIHND